ncbi:MAG TPA: sugar phosphate isomerase/epimerase [Phenylobacterium sp.]
MPSTSTLIHRRGFLTAGAALLAAPAMGAAAQPFFKRHGLPIGIQLYTVGPDAAKDLDGTLKALSGMGYRSVESAGFYGKSAAQFRAALDAAGVACPSAHIQGRGGLDGDLGKLADDLKTIGVKTAVMPSPYIPDRLQGKGLRETLTQLTADDFKMNADFLNAKAAGLKKAGIKVGYHNHNFELAPLGSTNGLEILLKNTDPALVTFEMDLGWVAAAGADPVALLNKHKGRFTAVHIKDLKASTKPNFALAMDPTEVGSGELDWKKILATAYATGVRGYYVEQEAPFAFPRLESAKIDHDFLAKVVA